MKSLTVLLAIVLLICVVQPSHGADWDGLAIPAKPPQGKKWKLQSISDDFNYKAGGSSKPKAFTNRWTDWFINPYSGPGLTEYRRDLSYTTGGRLAIKMVRKPGTKQVNIGCISSHKTFKFPLYVEAKAKISDQVLANGVWMLSSDSTQEIDIIEAYGSSRPDQEWFAHRMHISHHVFRRPAGKPILDYQPTDAGSWYFKSTPWRSGFNRVGVYWRDAWHLEYYINGKKVRTVSGKDKIDPKGYTGGTGLTKPQHIIINAESQTWRENDGVTATDDELKKNNEFLVDWVRVYKAE